MARFSIILGHSHSGLFGKKPLDATAKALARGNTVLANIDHTELLLIALGATGLARLFYKESRSVAKFRRYSTLAETSSGTLFRALSIVLKVYVAGWFANIDNPTLDNYKRFRKAINLLTMMVAANLILIAIMIFGVVMFTKQNSFESYIRPLDAFLIIVFFIVSTVAFFASDKVDDDVTFEKPSPVSIEGMRAHPFSKTDGTRILRPQEHSMIKPSLPSRFPRILNLQECSLDDLSADDQGLVAAAKASAAQVTASSALSGAEMDNFKTDPEAAKRHLIEAGILNEAGDLRDEYKRS